MKKRTRDRNLKPSSLASLGNYLPETTSTFFLGLATWSHPLDHRIFPRESPLPLLYIHEHDIDRIPQLVICVSVPIKGNEVDRVSDEPGIVWRERKLRQGRAICPEILSFSVERDLLTESFLISLVHSSFKRSGSFSNTHVNIRLFHISNHECQTPWF